MSGIVGAIVGGVTAFAAVTVAAVPEAAHALEPLFAFDSEYTVVAAALLFAVPALAVLTLLAIASED